MKIKCPACGRNTEWEDNPFRPFCSGRCKLMDLAAWASDKYRIEGKEDDDSGSEKPGRENDHD